MVGNTYEEVLDDWKVRLISRRAKQRGFRGQDLDDAIQRCAIAVMGFQFDASRSNGATESTVLTAVVDRQLLALRRRRHAANSMWRPTSPGQQT